MKLLKIKIHNFMCYEDVELSLDNKGLTLIVGTDVETGESNGSGKSTIFDALIWVFFGITCRGLSGDDVVTDRGKGSDCWVEIECLKDSDEFIVTRYRKHKKYYNNLRLLLNREDQTAMTVTATQERLLKYLGITYEVFINSIMFSPEVTNFFSTATDKERKILLDSILGFSKFDEALTVTRERKRSIISEQGLHEIKIEGLKANLESVNSHIHDLQVKNTHFEEDKRIKVKDLENQLKDLEKQIKVIDVNKFDDAIKKIDDKLTEIVKKERRAEEIRNELYKFDQNMAMLEASLQVAETNREGSQEKIKWVKNNVSVKCPLCDRIIDPKDAASVELYHQELIKHFELEMKGVDKDLENTGKIRDRYLDELDICKKLIGERYTILGEKDNFTKQRSEEKNKENILLISLEHVRCKLEETEKMISPYEDEILKFKKEVEEFDKELSELNEAVSVLLETKKYLEFWEVGFGSAGIKTFILDNVIPILNERMQYYSEILTEGNIGVSIDTQSVLKSGDIKEKISLKIDNIKGHSMYAGNSSGEKRRIDLVVLFALHDLIKMRSGIDFNISFYDEVFNTLDYAGVQRVMILLKEEASKRDSVFVISHDDNMKDFFTNRITVKKKNDKSWIEV